MSEVQKKLYAVVVPYRYEVGPDDERVTKTQWTQVGVGFETKDQKGVLVKIKPGLSVSGNFLVVERDDRGRKKGEEEAGTEECESGPGAASSFGRFKFDPMALNIDELV